MYMKFAFFVLPLQAFEFVLPDFLSRFSGDNWVLPEKTDVVDDLEVNLDYNSGMLQDYFEEERAELEAIEEYYENSELVTVESSQRKIIRYQELPNLVPQINHQTEMDQKLLNMLAFSFDTNGISAFSPEMFESYGCWCNFSRHAKGPVFDEIDAKCKARLQCRKCVEMDTNCSWNEHNYSVFIDTKP